MVYLVDLPFALEQGALKYFTVGHTLMSADSFHHMVEKEMKKMKQIHDWKEFVNCVSRCENIFKMRAEDFKLFRSELSQSRESRSTRPKPESVPVDKFRKRKIAYKKAVFLQKRATMQFLINFYIVQHKLATEV